MSRKFKRASSGLPADSAAGKPSTDVAGTDATKKPDGRRNNKPPEHGKIKPKEVRNPDGRRGKPKPAVMHSNGALSRFEQLYIELASRVVTRDAHGEVDALERLIQADWLAALQDGDDRARTRVLATAERILASRAMKQREELEWYMSQKPRFTALFAEAERTGAPPPEGPHPSHIVIRDTEVNFVGPIEPEYREYWEILKAGLRILEVWHDHARQRVKWDASVENIEDLKEIERERRILMRRVPKGWNWKERIYCRHSKLKSTDATIKLLKEEFDAECEARDRVSTD